MSDLTQSYMKRREALNEAKAKFLNSGEEPQNIGQMEAALGRSLEPHEHVKAIEWLKTKSALEVDVRLADRAIKVQTNLDKISERMSQRQLEVQRAGERGMAVEGELPRALGRPVSPAEESQAASLREGMRRESVREEQKQFEATEKLPARGDIQTSDVLREKQSLEEEVGPAAVLGQRTRGYLADLASRVEARYKEQSASMGELGEKVGGETGRAAMVGLQAISPSAAVGKAVAEVLKDAGVDPGAAHFMDTASQVVGQLWYAKALPEGAASVLTGGKAGALSFDQKAVLKEVAQTAKQAREAKIFTAPEIAGQRENYARMIVDQLGGDLGVAVSQNPKLYKTLQKLDRAAGKMEGSPLSDYVRERLDASGVLENAPSVGMTDKDATRIGLATQIGLSGLAIGATVATTDDIEKEMGSLFQGLSAGLPALAGVTAAAALPPPIRRRIAEIIRDSSDELRNMADAAPAAIIRPVTAATEAERTAALESLRGLGSMQGDQLFLLNWRRLREPGALNQAIKMFVDMRGPNLPTQQVTEAQAEALATALGMSARDFLELNPASMLNSHQVHAATELMRVGYERFTQLADRILAGDQAVIPEIDHHLGVMSLMTQRFLHFASEWGYIGKALQEVPEHIRQQFSPLRNTAPLESVDSVRDMILARYKAGRPQEPNNRPFAIADFWESISRPTPWEQFDIGGGMGRAPRQSLETGLEGGSEFLQQGQLPLKSGVPQPQGVEALGEQFVRGARQADLPKTTRRGGEGAARGAEEAEELGRRGFQSDIDPSGMTMAQPPLFEPEHYVELGAILKSVDSEPGGIAKFWRAWRENPDRNIRGAMWTTWVNGLLATLGGLEDDFFAQAAMLTREIMARSIAPGGRPAFYGMLAGGAAGAISSEQGERTQGALMGAAAGGAVGYAGNVLADVARGAPDRVLTLEGPALAIGAIHGWIDAIKSSGAVGAVGKATVGGLIGMGAGVASADSEGGAFDLITRASTGATVGALAGASSQLLPGLRNAPDYLKVKPANVGGELVGGIKSLREVPTPFGAKDFGADLLSSQILGLDPKGIIGSAIDYFSHGIQTAMDVTGKAVSVPGSVLKATETFYKGIAQRSIKAAEAYKQAVLRGEGLKDFSKIYKEYADGANPAANEMAEQFADYMTFTASLREGEPLNVARPGNPIVRVLSPFYKTGINVMKGQYDMLPGLNRLATQTRNELESPSAAIRDNAFGRLSTGVMLSSVGAYLAMNGVITGKRPVNRGLAEASREEEPEYSAKIGNTWISLDRLGVIGTQLTMVADFVTLASDFTKDDDTSWQDLAGAIALTLAHHAQSATYLVQWHDFMKAITATQPNQLKEGERFINRMGTSVVPTFSGQIRRAIDPYDRDVRGLLDALINKTAGMSTMLEPLIGLNGEPRRHGNGRLMEAFEPFRLVLPKNDPVSKKINDLNLEFAMPTEWIHGTSQASLAGGPIGPQKFRTGIKLDQEQTRWYHQLAGNHLKLPGWTLERMLHGLHVDPAFIPKGDKPVGAWDILTGLVKSGALDKYTPHTQGETIKSIMYAMRQAAMDVMVTTGRERKMLQEQGVVLPPNMPVYADLIDKYEQKFVRQAEMAGGAEAASQVNERLKLMRAIREGG